MDSVLAGLQWTNCLVYLDDMIILGRTFDKHLTNLKAIFDQFREAGLKLKLSKCVLCQLKVEFLGHIVSAKGVATDPGKTEMVTKWPVPRSRRKVQQFLGLANHYRRFVHNLVEIAKPLHHLIEKTAPFQWSTNCQDGFENLKHRLVSAPILAFQIVLKHLSWTQMLETQRIGAVLLQIQDDDIECIIT